MHEVFRKIASHISHAAGTAWAFIIAALIVIVWALAGPILGFSQTWQLAINTTTTIVTFLMVFVIQNTQNRDSKAVHLKLDELIRADGKARDSLLDAEELSDDDLEKLEDQYRRLHAHYSLMREKRRKKGK